MTTNFVQFLWTNRENYKPNLLILICQDFAPHYFAYVASCHESEHRSLLAKILGVFTVGFRNSATNKSLKIDVLVIENLFYKSVEFNRKNYVIQWAVP
jgi:hypothetical protein